MPGPQLLRDVLPPGRALWSDLRSEDTDDSDREKEIILSPKEVDHDEIEADDHGQFEADEVGRNTDDLIGHLENKLLTMSSDARNGHEHVSVDIGFDQLSSSAGSTRSASGVRSHEVESDITAQDPCSSASDVETSAATDKGLLVPGVEGAAVALLQSHSVMNDTNSEPLTPVAIPNANNCTLTQGDRTTPNGKDTTPMLFQRKVRKHKRSWHTKNEQIRKRKHANTPENPSASTASQFIPHANRKCVAREPRYVIVSSVCCSAKIVTTCSLLIFCSFAMILCWFNRHSIEEQISSSSIQGEMVDSFYNGIEDESTHAVRLHGSTDKEMLESGLLYLARPEVIDTMRSARLHRDFFEPAFLGRQPLLDNVTMARQIPLASFFSETEYIRRHRFGDFVMSADVRNVIKLILVHADVPQFKYLFWFSPVEKLDARELASYNKKLAALPSAVHSRAVKLQQIDDAVEAFLSDSEPFGFLLIHSGAIAGMSWQPRDSESRPFAAAHHWTLIRIAGQFRAIHSFGGLFSLDEALRERKWFSMKTARRIWGAWRTICSSPSDKKASNAATKFFRRGMSPGTSARSLDMSVSVVTGVEVKGFLSALSQVTAAMEKVGLDAKHRRDYPSHSSTS